MASILLKLRKKAKEETPFMKNGRILLEELISSCDGKCNPICTFSAKELQQATNKYDSGQRIIEESFFAMYKGFLEDRPISVKKYSVSMQTSQIPVRDIVVGSQMSVHKNVLKLIGCCLETEHPILVYEFVGSETLSRYMNRHPHVYHCANEMQPLSLSWKHRLKVAVDIANAIAYLHTALSRPVIHRDIKPGKILLDENYVAKLMDFSLSIAIPEGETGVMDGLAGTIGFIAPEHFKGPITEKSDVYSFGIVLSQLFTGQEACNCPFCGTGDDIDFESEDDIDFEPGDYIWVTRFKNYIARNGIEEIIDPVIMAEGPLPEKEQQLKALIALALRCINVNADNRPTMIEVGKELRQIYQYVICPS